ncbi:MAG: hypothetical protein IPM46_11745 [Flavobacteriales bacterium]|nr:hypothetical protein [Flavobacteriales bacterium]
MSAAAIGTADRTARIVAWALPVAVLAYLTGFAWRYADERLYADSGYYLARVINEGTFRIEHGRWALGLAQMLPLLGVKLGLPMKALIILHSLNNAVWLGACMLFAWRVLRSPHAVMSLAVVHLIGLTHGLFCPVFELYYGIDLLILFHATWHASHLRSITRWSLRIVLFLAVISSHLFGALLMACLLALERIWSNRRAMILFAVLFAAYAVQHAMCLTLYEKDHLATMVHAGRSGAWMNLLAPAAWWDSVRYVVRHYPDVALLSILALVTFIRQGARWRSAWLIGLLLGLHVIIAMKLPGHMHDRYREQVNFAATGWVAILFVLHALPLARKPNLLMIALCLAVVWRCARAEHVAGYYRERVGVIESWVDQARSNGLSKAIVPGPRYFGTEHHTIELQWSVPVESLLLSSKNGPEGTVSLLTAQDLEHGDVRDQLDDFIFRRWDVMDPAWLDPRYFTAPTGRYTMLPQSLP